MAVVFGLAWINAVRAQTVISLSATGSVVTIADEMEASLNVQDSAAAAPAAQDAVNRLMAKSLASARKINGLAATTTAYNVFQTQTGYQASQTLNLIMPAKGGVPPPAFTSLVGQLQQAGLQLNSLDGQLSAAAVDAASQAATTDALHRLLRQASAIAATLGDKPGEIKTITIDSGDSGPVMPGRVMALEAAAPPQSAPGPVTIQVTVEATILLTPLAP